MPCTGLYHLAKFQTCQWPIPVTFSCGIWRLLSVYGACFRYIVSADILRAKQHKGAVLVKRFWLLMDQISNTADGPCPVVYSEWGEPHINVSENVPRRRLLNRFMYTWLERSIYLAAGIGSWTSNEDFTSHFFFTCSTQPYWTGLLDVTWSSVVTILCASLLLMRNWKIQIQTGTVQMYTGTVLEVCDHLTVLLKGGTTFSYPVGIPC